MTNNKPKRPARPSGPGRSKPSGTNRRKPTQSSSRKPVRRVRPKVQAEARRAKTSSRPMPKPPARRPVARKTVEAPSEEIKAQMEEVQDKFARLETEAQLSAIYSEIGGFDSQLIELPLTIESLRDRGYVHSEQLEDKLEALDAQWDEVRPRVESTLKEQIERLDKELDRVEKQVERLTPNASSIKAVEMVVDSLERRVEAAKSAVGGLYEGMQTDLSTTEYQLSRIAAMLDLLDESLEIQLYEAEGPLLAVKTEWHQNEDEGPEGVLFLTDQRLLFEQREEVVTKKRLGIFKAESEKIQKLLLDIQIHHIDSISHKEEGGFLGMGKADILELVMAAQAPVSRARFHLKGQDSADWAAMIKRVQTGDIDADRAEDYLDELEEAEGVAGSFPTTCPNCFAAVPPPPRGVSSVTCEFCGAVITSS